jgi:F-type H+-transporting ATPase subunit b
MLLVLIFLVLVLIALVVYFWGNPNYVQKPFPVDSEIINKLLPNVPNLISHTIAFILILLILYKYGWRTFTKVINSRKQYIADQISETEAKREESIRINLDAKNAILKARLDGENLVDRARDEAVLIKEVIINDGRNYATKIKEDAMIQIEQERQKLSNQVIEKITDGSILLAEKILNSKIDIKKDKELINDFLANFDKENK